MRLLSARLIVSLIVGVTLVSLCTSYYQVIVQKQALRKDLQHRAEVLGESLARNVERDLERDAQHTLQRTVQQFIAAAPCGLPDHQERYLACAGSSNQLIGDVAAHADHLGAQLIGKLQERLKTLVVEWRAKETDLYAASGIVRLLGNS